MRIYRICDAAWAHEPFSGNGGLYRAGRWHSLGTRLAYASAEQGTAMLEALTNVARESLLVVARALVVETVPVTTAPVTIVPDDLVVELDRRAWPNGWDADVHPAATRELGGARARGRTALGPIVPSSTGDPPSFDALIDPEPPRAGRIEIGRTTPFAVDARLGAEPS